jgi:uncharacterized membrane-anchored protein
MRLAFLVVVGAQVLFLVGFIAQKETTLRTGREVTLQTVPVDPRDLFRGDYVNLRYTVSTLETRGMPTHDIFAPGDTVYVLLDVSGEVAVARAVAKQPRGGWDVFIRGTVREASGELQMLRVEYGLESYFVPEGQGRPIERAQDVKAVAVVDGNGRAILSRLIVDGAVLDTKAKQAP